MGEYIQRLIDLLQHDSSVSQAETLLRLKKCFSLNHLEGLDTIDKGRTRLDSKTSSEVKLES